MRIRVIAGLTLLLHVAAFACLANAAHAAGRVALVIGNSAYEKAPVLPNPTRDANDVADALGRLGFNVTRATNLNGNDMRRALTAFGRAAVGADMAVVYYAGHGIEVGGENWLIPVDAELQRDIDTENEAVSLKAVTLQVSQTLELGLVILDACRSNPFNNSMKRLTTTRAVSRGFTRVEPSRNVLVAYAAKDGTTASDGHGRNSPFTAALLQNLETPGLEIGFLFRRIRDEVLKATANEQEPFLYGSLSGQSIYLKTAAASPASPSSAFTPSAVAAQSVDEVLWDLIKNSAATASIEEFLIRYPASSRAKDARARLETLKAKQLAAVAPQQPVTAPAPPAPADEAAARGYPGQTIKMVVPYAAGGHTDVLGRIVAEQLKNGLGATVIVENRAGASGAIGSDMVAKSKADGYTLLMANQATLAINKTLYSKLPYDPVRDFAPVALVARVPYVLIVNPKLPAKTLSEFIVYAKSQPGRLTYGSVGVGSAPHLAAEMLRSAAGIDAMHVPYRSSVAAMPDLIGGLISFMMVDLITAEAHIKQGKVRALGVTTPERVATLPGIPTITEGGLKGFEVMGWHGVVAPAGTPRAIVDKLAVRINTVMTNPAMREKLEAMGVEPVSSSTPEQFAAYLKAEVDRWAVAVVNSGAKVE